jgi:hypothetical protein
MVHDDNVIAFLNGSPEFEVVDMAGEVMDMPPQRMPAEDEEQKECVIRYATSAI